MSDSSIYNFKHYNLKCKTSWFSNNDGSGIPVKMFSYHLSQYTPSVYAEVILTIDLEKFDDFKTIEQLEIKNRTIEVYFEPELYYPLMKKNYFAGPYKFCVVSYDIQNLKLTNIELNKKVDSAKIITLKCIDATFYKMTLNENYNSFGKINISDIIKKLVTNNGGKANTIIDTNYAYRWLQTGITDYDMIRTMLPYAKANNGNLLYTFFMLNNEAYFAPIATGKKTPVSLSVDNVRNLKTSVNDDSYKYMIEKYGNKDKLYCAHHGYNNFEQVNPVTMTNEAYSNSKIGNKQHKGVGTKYINTVFEDKTLQEIYISNIRHRIYTFSKMLELDAFSIPDITPINCIEIINEKSNNKSSVYDGIYYVASIKYTYGESPNRFINPTMHLVLCSELDVKGMESPEGSASV